MRSLIQRTIDTGQERLSPLSEVEPDILAKLRPLVREAVKSGQPVHVGANWWCRATTVTPGKGDAPALLEVKAANLLQAAAHGQVTESQADMAGDLARCLVWAWLASPR